MPQQSDWQVLPGDVTYPWALPACSASTEWERDLWAKFMLFPNSFVPKEKVPEEQTPISSMLRLSHLLAIATGNK